MTRWKNLAEGGHTMFVSTTVLGFVPIFEDVRAADTITAAVIADCKYEGAKLDAFVVMPEHIHLLLQVPKQLTGSRLMDRLKSAWANRILDVAADSHLRALATAKQKLASRTVWQRSFRGLVIEGEDMWLQKLEYIHANPVRRGLCERPEAYPWSSAKLWQSGHWNEELLVEDDVVAQCWPDAVVDSLSVVVRRVSATHGWVARS